MCSLPPSICLRPSACLLAPLQPLQAQGIPNLVSLPSPLPAGIPEEQAYIRRYCAARGLPYPLQAREPFGSFRHACSRIRANDLHLYCPSGKPRHAISCTASPPAQADWRFYLALSIFRLASILAGVGARAAQGNASSRIAAQVRAGGWEAPLALHPAAPCCLFSSACS